MMIEEKLFSLLRLAFWGESMKSPVSKEEFAEVLRLAEQQTVYGLVFDGLSRLNEKYDKQQVLQGLAICQKIQNMNELVNKEMKGIVQILNQRNIDYLIVKGQTIGVLYPKQHLRMPGDIDFLIRQEYNEVKEVIEKDFSIKLPEQMVEREIGFVHGGVSFELHTNLRDWGRKKHDEVWDTLMEKEWINKYYVEIDGVKVRTLTATMNAAYVFIHLFFHFIREGVSLRQLCDWLMVLHYYKDEIDQEALVEILLDLDMLDAFCAFGTILVDYLGLPANDFPLPLDEKNRKWQKKLLKDIFAGGNFGKLHHRADNSWKFKLETMQLAFRNTFKYYRLCPSEVGGMIPRLIKGNMKILLS